jgi:DNA-binding transcriptional MerR regulator
MQSEESEATYNLKAVIRETGVKADTLRAWERRYGLPAPVRTPGGHRLYSGEDIEMLKWLVLRQEEGVAISQAVAMWQRLQEKGHDPLQKWPTPQPAAEPPERLLSPTSPEGTETDNLERLRQHWLQGCLAFDEQSADTAVTQALAMYSPEQVCAAIFQKGLAEIGMQWYAGNVTPQQEHFASALAARRVEALIHGTPPPVHSGRIVIGCAPEDEHTFSPLLLSLLLRRRGRDVLYLGANVPTEHFETTVATTSPRLVILTAQTLHSAATTLHTGQLMAREGVPFAWGGIIFASRPAIRQRMPGWYLGDVLQNAPTVVEQILTTSRPQPVPLPRSAAYREAETLFMNRLPRIEAHIWDAMPDGAVSPGQLYRANQDMARTIAAALSLGDITLAGEDITWLEGLLINYSYRFPTTVLTNYLNLYRQAIDAVLGERGTLISHWLQQVVN